MRCMMSPWVPPPDPQPGQERHFDAAEGGPVPTSYPELPGPTGQETTAVAAGYLALVQDAEFGWQEGRGLARRQAPLGRQTAGVVGVRLPGEQAAVRYRGGRGGGPGRGPEASAPHPRARPRRRAGPVPPPRRPPR